MIDMVEARVIAGQISDPSQARPPGNEPLRLHEFLFALAQGYDAVALQADL